MSFKSVLEKFRKESFSERDKGFRFEHLMQAYLQTDPKYSNILKHVWLWNDFLGKNDLGGIDSGIDLVAQTYTGDYWAIQCKFFAPDSTIDKKAVDSFLSTSSREFKNENYQTISFSHRLWISTTNHWGKNAEEAIRNQNPPVTRINFAELEQSTVDWDNLEKGIVGEISRTPKKELRPHQQTALDNAHEYFKTQDRGKLIMACGTGKTFNALRIAENETDGKGLILFLVPSIALLGQSLREWCENAKEPINPICICSDPKVTSKQSRNSDPDSFSVVDLALPASTNVETILEQFRKLENVEEPGMTVVFSTYQSIDVIAKAQQALMKSNNKFGSFDLIICDEAHRTTGVTLADSDEAAFVKVHNNDFIKAKKRLYMTATPRLYSDDSKSKAARAEAILCSMDDTAIYGEEIYRIGFGEAVERDLLSDYKVIVLTLNENDIPPALQNVISNKESEINTDDISKLIGCINALSKKMLGDANVLKNTDPEPMRRAVAFCQNIAVSKKITETFNTSTEVYLSSLSEEKREGMVSLTSKHIDGTMAAPERDDLLGWLKSNDTDQNECRVLTNVRCLSEGVDVPSLDAVLFLSARNSQVDVVQSVGRVMRKADGKKYGYIIIPVIVPTDIDAGVALDDNERYKVVWTVLNALRAHDDRFNATINKIELNKHRPDQILVGRPDVGYFVEHETGGVGETKEPYGNPSEQISRQLAIQFEQLQNIVFARMVQKVGDRRYWEQWAKSVAEIAERQVERITRLINEDQNHKKAFEEFLAGLQKNINPSITQQEAVEMLSQHVITKPVFEALFEGYSFVKNNPISVSMQTMLDLLEEQAIEKDTETLQKFYDSVKMRAKGIDNAEGKQKIIIELYDKFFKAAFPKMVEKLGIVYTPVEVVDFIIHSVNDILKKEFDRSLTDENIHILDPFTGTGTFITRLLQSGLIENKDLSRKYLDEIHANEIVLLAYYIAAINIENAYHDAMNAPEYVPFDGICLTDTFQLGETDSNSDFIAKMFPENSERVAKQRKAPLRVIIGNPPYSIGQKSANDNAQNQKYERLDSRIAQTYAAQTKATNVNSLYDSYIKAFRWSTDRLDPENGGVICFVSNGAWIDGNSTDGFRKCLENEFSSIYVFNLRGNQRTSGELSRKEGGKIFGSGSRTPIAITLLVKKPKFQNTESKIFYHDIGDYLNREEKLSIVKKLNSVSNNAMKWNKLIPNEHGDWISHRNNLFETYIPIETDKKFDLQSNSFFVISSLGLTTGRDAWCVNYSLNDLQKNISSMIEFYNNQVDSFVSGIENNTPFDIDNSIDTDSKKISWSRGLKRNLINGNKFIFNNYYINDFLYRPFTNQRVYYTKNLNEYVYQWSKFYPTNKLNNIFICISSSGATTGLSLLISKSIVDAHFNGDTHCFPLYYYEERLKQNPGLFEGAGKNEFVRRDGISDFIFERAKVIYGKSVTKEDIFYYVYGFLHSPVYREMFANDLKKMLPRLPLVDDVRDFWKFSKAGRTLADLHINYESVPAYPDVKVTGAESGFFKVEKMRFPKKDQKDTIIYNSKIIIENIPEKAYEYIVNGKSAIEWIMERYQVTTHKESGIKNDPNDWADEVGNPRYILDLLLSIINVSVQTVDIVNGLPKVEFEVKETEDVL